MLVSQLEAFRATVKCGTVSGAANLLGVSQPAISRAIARLEESLGITLFDRRNGRLSATWEATILFDHVEQSFASFDKIKEVASEIREARRGHLRIAAMPALSIGFLPQVICAFKRIHPDVTISIEVQHSIKVEDWAFSQSIDFGIAELPSHRQGLQAETFCRVPMYAIVPLHHPLAVKQTICPLDLKDEPLIALLPPQVGRKRLNDALMRYGIDKTMVVETQNYALACELVLGGLGLSIVDPFTAMAYKARGLAMIPFLPMIDFHVGLLHPAHRSLSRAASSFLALLRRHKTNFIASLPLAPEAEPIADL